ncbi:MAG: hypothetical protein ACFUZC_11715 [Chthoniobacteraceae bacterium]
MTEQKAGLLGSPLLVPQADLYVHNQRLGLIQNLQEARLSKRFLYYLFHTSPVLTLWVEHATTPQASNYKDS